MGAIGKCSEPGWPPAAPSCRGPLRPTHSAVTLGVGRRDQAQLAVEDVDQVVEIARTRRRSPRASAARLRDLMWPLMSVPELGSRASRMARAAFWW